ncbi:MAG: esterase/lipase family protein [Thermoanaerobaculia bacterium]
MSDRSGALHHERWMTGNRSSVTGHLLLLVALVIANCTTDHTRRGYLHTIASTYDAPPPRPVVIVPGFGVTRLFDPVRHRYVWGTAHATVQRHFEDDLDLPIGDDGSIGRDRLIPRGYVGSRGPVNIGWQLREGLRKFGGYAPDRDVFTFEYDWRLSARDNAIRLGNCIDAIRRNGKVDVITHSAGSLVALAYVKLGGGAERVEHLVLIAPAQRGVVDAFRVVVRPERFLRRVFTPEMVATWPSVPELLPDDGRFVVDEQGRPVDFDAWRAGDWSRFMKFDDAHRRAFARSLAAARELRDDLRRAPLPPGVKLTVLAGDCVETAQRVLARRDGSFAFYPGELRAGEAPLRKTMFELGDGTVPVSSAKGDSTATLFCDGHQGIAADPNVHRAILRILR